MSTANQIKWGKQLGLAASLFVLGSFAYWLEYSHRPKKDAQEEQSKKLFVLTDTQVHSVRLSDNGRVFEITCTDVAAKLCKPGDFSKWQLAEPTKVKADDSNANSLVSTLNNLNATETIDLKDETPEKRLALLKEYGLDAQTLKQGSTKAVTVKTATGETTLFLGQLHPIGEAFFAIRSVDGKADENRVFLVPNYFKSNFEHDRTYWREKKLFALSSHEIQSFRLEGPKSHLTAVKTDGQWTLRVKNEDFTGDIENVESLLATATNLTAKEFTADDKSSTKAKSVLNGARRVLTLTLQKEKGSEKEAPAPDVLTLYEKRGASNAGRDRAGAPTAKLYATLSGADPLYELDAATPDRLDKTVKDLRLTKLITSMERFTAKRLEFSGTPIGTPALVFKSDNGKWVNSADKAAVNTEKISELLDKLSGPRIKDFLVGSAIPAGEQDGLKFILGDEKSDTKRQIVFWKANEKLYARDLQSKRIEAFQVDNSVTPELPLAPGSRDFFKKSDSGKTASR